MHIGRFSDAVFASDQCVQELSKSYCLLQAKKSWRSTHFRPSLTKLLSIFEFRQHW